ncbi:MAG TPA: hypothetical protein VMZ11_07710 [Mycobacteriales bacterium]|nr:hypothetical protein [Mycobacteriales bacterium]
MSTTSIKRWGTGAALLASGLVAGGVLAGSLTANAASGDTTSPSATTTQQAPLNPGDPTKAQRSDETLLTGDTAAKVRAAALAKYPGATIQRVETDSDGIYEAHLVTKDGQPVTVEMDKAYQVTGTEAGGPGGHGRGGPPPASGNAPTA